jgi:hypothetical protein
MAVIGLRDDVQRFVSLSGVRGSAGIAERQAADTADYARNLYRWFAELDELGIRLIVAVLPAADGIGRELRDRLDRASGGTRTG